LFGADSSASEANSSSKAVNTCQAARQESHVFESAQSNVKVNPCQARRQESHIFDQPANQSSVHTTSKVLKPPGGGSSITFG
jgi:ribosomal protein S27E